MYLNDQMILITFMFDKATIQGLVNKISIPSPQNIPHYGISPLYHIFSVFSDEQRESNQLKALVARNDPSVRPRAHGGYGSNVYTYTLEYSYQWQ